MDRAVANVQRFTGIPLADAVRLATRNPARMLGLQTGAVAPGSDADFVLFNNTGAFSGCIVRGTRVT